MLRLRVNGDLDKAFYLVQSQSEGPQYKTVQKSKKQCVEFKELLNDICEGAYCNLLAVI